LGTSDPNGLAHSVLVPRPDTDVDLRGVVRDLALNIQVVIATHPTDGKEYCIVAATDPRPPRGLAPSVVLTIAHAALALESDPHVSHLPLSGSIMPVGLLFASEQDANTMLKFKNTGNSLSRVPVWVQHAAADGALHRRLFGQPPSDRLFYPGRPGGSG